MPPLVLHVIHRFAVGGMENGLVNLINHMPSDRYQHAILCLTHSTAFSQRLRKKSVEVFELGQRSGRDYRIHRRVFRLLRSLQPDIVHTRNLPALEFQVVAALAGVRARVHGEHGRDMYDLDGANFKYNLVRKAVRPFVTQYIAVSMDLAQWLTNTIRVPQKRVNQIYNGVDAEKFSPRKNSVREILPRTFASTDVFIVGTVGRMEPVKDQLTLVRAFVHLVRNHPEARRRLRLALIGDGALRAPAAELLREAEMENLAWLPGESKDVPNLMRAFDLFVLPSLREGISNTILEAMASGIPVVATDVGGNPELIDVGETGALVPHSDPHQMAQAIASYLTDSSKLINQGGNARKAVERRFGMDSMVNAYARTYDRALNEARRKVHVDNESVCPSVK